MTVVFGLEMSMHTKFENGILPNRQNPVSAVNSCIGMKTLSGRRALHCDKHHFYAIKLSLPHTFVFSCLPQGFLGN